MRLLIIITCLLLSGCYTKKRAIDKFCVNDTLHASIIVHDTITIQTIQKDTVFSARVVSIYLVKDNLRVKYIRVLDSIYLSGECLGDTIYKEKIVNVSIPINLANMSFKDWLKGQSKFTKFLFYGSCALSLLAILMFLAARLQRYLNKL